MKNVLQLGICVAITAILLSMLSATSVMWCFILLGQAHFIMAYWYKWRTGGMDKPYASRFVVSALSVGIILLFLHASLPLIIVAASAIFALHFSTDEIYLVGNEFRRMSLLVVLPFVALYVAHTSDVLEHTQIMPAAEAFAVVCFIAFVVASLRWGWSFGEVWVLALGSVFVAAISLCNIPIEKALGAIIILHYMHWYFVYVFRFASTPKLLPYLRDVFIANVISASLFSIFWWLPGSALGIIGSLFFLPANFYGWTILHIASSVRMKDYRGLVFKSSI